MTERRSRINGANRDLRYPLRAAKWILVLWISLAPLSNSALSLAQAPPAQAQPAPVAGVQETLDAAPQAAPDQPQPGGVSGTVVDPDGAVIANVKITLTQTGVPSGVPSTGVASKREARSDGNGYFVFAGVAPGPFQLSLSAPGFAPLEQSGILHAGEYYIVPQIVLAVARNTEDGEVTLPQEQVAEDQVKVEEKQRLLGVFPNFYVTYDPKAVPLTTKLKFQLAWKSTIDPVSFIVTGAVAGIEQADNLFSA